MNVVLTGRMHLETTFLQSVDVFREVRVSVYKCFVEFKLIYLITNLCQ